MFDKARFEKQLSFLKEIDSMKTILRRSIIIDQSKREDDAEHSWHIAMIAMVLFEYAYSPKIDLLRVIKMCLVHDLVEVYAGATYCYDEVGYLDKEDREKRAADRLFGLLPDDQNVEYHTLWEEFDKMETPDSVYAAACDRFEPFILNYYTNGYTWQLGDITSDKVYKRLEQAKNGLPELWETVDVMIKECIDKGSLKK